MRGVRGQNANTTTFHRTELSTDFRVQTAGPIAAQGACAQVSRVAGDVTARDQSQAPGREPTGQSRLSAAQGVKFELVLSRFPEEFLCVDNIQTC